MRISEAVTLTIAAALVLIAPSLLGALIIQWLGLS